jgi:hypothetical protein
MTPKQLKKATTKELVVAYKHKARCYWSERQARSIYVELLVRLGSQKLQAISLETWHMRDGEGDREFNKECDKLIATL